jgi:hypothetical protein
MNKLVKIFEDTWHTFDPWTQGRDLITRELTKKYENLLDACTPEFRRLLENNIYFAGGCLKSIWHKEEVKDYDLWFFEPDHALELFMKAYRGSNRIPYMDNDPFFKEGSEYYFRSLSANAMNINGPKGEVFQIIFTYYGTPQEVTSKFDFEHCKSYFVPQTKELFLNKNMLYRKLVYVPGAPWPLSAMKRAMKFKAQGWELRDDQLLAIVKDIQKLDLNDPEVIERHLHGMYRTY